VGNTSYFIKFADSRSQEPGPTPAAVEPPTPENIHLYRTAVLAWRKAEIEELSRRSDIRLANPHVADHAAARAVHELASEMTYPARRSPAGWKR
jgi:hypothetical protein